jgi:hypothetical protein
MVRELRKGQSYREDSKTYFSKNSKEELKLTKG